MPIRIGSSRRSCCYNAHFSVVAWCECNCGGRGGGLIWHSAQFCSVLLSSRSSVMLSYAQLCSALGKLWGRTDQQYNWWRRATSEVNIPYSGIWTLGWTQNRGSKKIAPLLAVPLKKKVTQEVPHTFFRTTFRLLSTFFDNIKHTKPLKSI